MDTLAYRCLNSFVTRSEGSRPRPTMNLSMSMTKIDEIARRSLTYVSDLQMRSFMVINLLASARYASPSTQGSLRKTQALVAADVKEKQQNSGILTLDENRYMPKGSILRSDGASLSEVYRAKKEDAWGKIIKTQLYSAVWI